MLVPEAQHQPAHLESAPPSCETAGSKLPASASDTPSYPKRGWGFPPPFCSLLPCFPAPAGMRGCGQRRREAGQSRRPGEPPPPPRGAVGAVRVRRVGPTGAGAGFQECSGGSRSGAGRRRATAHGASWDSARGCSSRPRGGGGRWLGTGVAWLSVTPSPRWSIPCRAVLPTSKSPKAAAKAASRRCGSRRVPPGPSGPEDLHRPFPPALCGGFCRRSAALG